MANTFDDVNNEKIAENLFLDIKSHDLKSVQADGNCLISAVILGHLGRFINKPKKFIIEAKKMFPNLFQEQISEEEFIADEQYYKLFHNFKRLQNPENISELIPLILLFRKRISNYIRENLNIKFSSNISFSELILVELVEIKRNYEVEIENIKRLQASLLNLEMNQQDKLNLKEIYNKQIIDLNEKNNFLEEMILKSSEEQINYYLSALEQNGTWCGDLERIAICNTLGSRISVKNVKREYDEFNQNTKTNIWDTSYTPSDNKVKTESEINLCLDTNNNHYSYFQINSDWQDKQIKSYREKLLDKKEELFSFSEEELILLEQAQDEKLNKLQENQDKLEELLLEEQSELKSVDRNKLVELKLFYEEQSISILKEIEITDNDIAQHYQSKAIEDSLIGEEQEFFCD